MKIFEIKGDTITVDLTKVSYDYTKEQREILNVFFDSLDKYSMNSEMMITIPRHEFATKGGLITIPWNTLAGLINALANELNCAKPNWFKRLLRKLKSLI